MSHLQARAETQPSHVHCQCGDYLGEPCAWTGPIGDTVVVEVMPDHLRGSHRAAGNWGSYPANGAERLRVHRDCAEWICRLHDDEGDTIDEPDEYNHIVAEAEVATDV